MGTISNLSVSLTANTRGLQKGLNKARGNIKRFSKSVFSMKNTVLAAFGVGGIGIALKSATDAFRKQEQAVASLEAANKSMGRSTAGITDSLIALASQIQREGIIGDEAIIQGQAFLSTFGQIPDKLMPRATRAMVDLMAKTGQSGQAAANMIGKASMGLSGALRIAGITLSDTTMAAIENEKKIKKMAESAGVNIKDLNRESKIFEMILKDIEAQIGGTNKALARTDTGALDQLSNSAGDLREKLGEIVASGIAPFARQLSADIDNTTINVDELGLSFRTFLMETVEGIGPLIQAFNGVKLVIKSLKLGFLGFGLLVTGYIKSFISGFIGLGKVLGMDIGEGAFDFWDKAFKDQEMNVRSLSAEIGELYDDLEARSTAGKFEDNLTGFFDRAKATQAGLDKPEIRTPDRTGSLDKLIINPGKVNQRVVIDKAPQIDRTNTLLETLINQPNVAVAG